MIKLIIKKYYKDKPADFTYLKQYGYNIYKELGRGGYGVVYKASEWKDGKENKQKNMLLKQTFKQFHQNQYIRKSLSQHYQEDFQVLLKCVIFLLMKIKLILLFNILNTNLLFNFLLILKWKIQNIIFIKCFQVQKLQKVQEYTIEMLNQEISYIIQKQEKEFQQITDYLKQMTIIQNNQKKNIKEIKESKFKNNQNCIIIQKNVKEQQVEIKQVLNHLCLQNLFQDIKIKDIQLIYGLQVLYFYSFYQKIQHFQQCENVKQTQLTQKQQQQIRINKKYIFYNFYN
ncbi:protein kinase domain protein [Ichthyophthirius multifiliis]|uniref:Protein kinase domain protein n=1 Tax=Ichthyophthirius multifiliis TaxID=5932 RepID=G0R378_ICHMU|nr:protein kinase domain protein [Ichthyophthirius multifiliis]EGR28076.1 protein kinase domain protein [Ichthyophthirius multifiliis]|eukprot:XP_004027421.1 protein kinase domain protein [Ichthyophthirius multifiliis]